MIRKYKIYIIMGITVLLLFMVFADDVEGLHADRTGRSEYGKALFHAGATASPSIRRATSSSKKQP